MGFPPNPIDSIDPSDTEDIDAALLSILGCALSEVLHQIIGEESELKPSVIGLRAIAIVHELRPDILHGRSTASLARECQCSRAWLSKISTQFRDRVGMFSTPAVSDRIRALHSQRATAVHARNWKHPSG